MRKTGRYIKPMTLPEQIQVLARGTLDNTERINKVEEQDLKELRMICRYLGLVPENHMGEKSQGSCHC